MLRPLSHIAVVLFLAPTSLVGQGPIGGADLAGGDFEAGTPSPHWVEASAVFLSPVCIEQAPAAPSPSPACGNGGGTAGPHSGAWWAWFGGFPGSESSSLRQVFTVPKEPPYYLAFWIWNGSASGAPDVLRIDIEGQVIFEAVAGERFLDGYHHRRVSLADFAAGRKRELTISFETALPTGTGVTNFSIDDIALVPMEAWEIPTLGRRGQAGLALLLAAAGVLATLRRRRVG